MKITSEHLATLRSLITPYDTPELRAKYIAANLSDARYHWDLATQSDKFLNTEPERSALRFICDVLYGYLDDTHIATAMRRIVPPLKLPDFQGL